MSCRRQAYFFRNVLEKSSCSSQRTDEKYLACSILGSSHLILACNLITSVGEGRVEEQIFEISDAQSEILIHNSTQILVESSADSWNQCLPIPHYTLKPSNRTVSSSIKLSGFGLHRLLIHKGLTENF